MSKQELWNEMADWLTDAFTFFERCLSTWNNFRVKVSGLVPLRPTVNLAFRDMYQIHWGLLTCLGIRDIYSLHLILFTWINWIVLTLFFFRDRLAYKICQCKNWTSTRFLLPFNLKFNDNNFLTFVLFYIFHLLKMNWMWKSSEFDNKKLQQIHFLN